jgi:hypothetical protein
MTDIAGYTCPIDWRENFAKLVRTGTPIASRRRPGRSVRLAVEEPRWGVRVADVWLPRFWPVAVIVSSLFARRHDATQLRRATETLRAR